MRVLLLCLLTAALAFAAHPPRSACSKHTRGRLWPEEANANRPAAIELMRSGAVYMCSYGLLRYRWEPLAVNLKTLEEDHPQPKDDAAGGKPQPTSSSAPAPPRSSP
jgi:hypothetical protein